MNSPAIPVVKPTRSEMLQRVAYFKDVPVVNTGLPDMHIDGYRRGFLALLGFDQPTEEGLVSPSGSAVRPVVNEPTAAVGVVYIQCEPGNGVMMHNHDTNENFLVISGRWDISWEGAEGTDKVTLGPRDFIALPPYVHRRFECVEAGDGEAFGLLLGIVGAQSVRGGPAAAEFSPEAQAAMAQAGPPPVAA